MPAYRIEQTQTTVKYVVIWADSYEEALQCAEDSAVPEAFFEQEERSEYFQELVGAVPDVTDPAKCDGIYKDDVVEEP